MGPIGKETENRVARQGRQETVRQLGNGDLSARGRIVGPRLWLFRMTALIVIPVVLLVLIELSLRVTGFGYPTSAIIERNYAGRRVCINNMKFGWRFFPKQIARELGAFVFPVEKSPQTFRMFVLGGSAAMGVPEPEYGFSRILNVLLEDGYPDLDFEVINMGMPAINSYGSLEMAKDCARYEPDLFIVYLGNNEVTGPYGAGTVFAPLSPSLSAARASIAVKSTKLGQLLEELASALAPEGERSIRWKGLQMFLDKQVRFDSKGLQYVYEHFERNLTDICNIGREAGAEVIVCSVASNLKDCPPFASLHSPDLTRTGEAMWNIVYNEAVQLESEGKYAEAMEKYRSALKIDRQPAEVHFRMGRCYSALGEHARAQQCFIEARNLDTLRFRADEQINDAVRRVAQNVGEGVSFVDVVQACRDASPHDMPGRELFYEHVHFNFTGNYLLARTVFDNVEKVIHEQTGIKPHREGAIPSKEDCAARLAFTGWDRLRIARQIYDGFERNPVFINQAYHGGQLEESKQWLDGLEYFSKPAGLQECVEQYRRALERNPSDWKLRRCYGQFLHEALNAEEEAVSQLEMVLEVLPHCYVYNELSILFYKLGRVDEGLKMARLALKMKPFVAWTYYNIGLGHDKKGNLRRAVKYYSKALEINPEVSAGAYDSLAQVFYIRGRIDKAFETLRDGIKIFPQSADLYCRLGIFLRDQGKITAAADSFRAALRIRPDYPLARDALAALQVKSRD